MLYVKLPEACPLALQVLPPPALAFLGAPPLDVKPEKICNDDKCDMYNYLKPVPLSIWNLHVPTKVSMCQIHCMCCQYLDPILTVVAYVSKFWSTLTNITIK